MQVNIIVDTSCLVLLEKIEKLDILKKLFGTVIVTPTIEDEYDLVLPEWINIREIKNKEYKKILQTSVDCGEASAIALATETGGLLILDDNKARKLALELGLDYTGTLGVLVDAKQSGYIKSFRKVLERIKKTNFYLSEDLEKALLEMVKK